MRIEVRVLDVLPGPLEVSRHRVEPFAKGADDVRVRHLEGLTEQVLGDARLGAQAQEAAIEGELLVGRPFLRRGGSVFQGPVPGREEQDLIVDSRQQEFAHRAALELDLLGHAIAIAGQLDTLLHGTVDPVDVLDEAARDLVHLVEKSLAYLHLPDRLDDLCEARAVPVELRAGGGELVGGVGGDEARRGGDEEGPALGEQERGIEVGNAALGDAALGVADIEERVASDEACGERERECSPEPQVELPRDSETAPPGARGSFLVRRNGPGDGRSRPRVRVGSLALLAHRSARATSRSMGR